MTFATIIHLKNIKKEKAKRTYAVGLYSPLAKAKALKLKLKYLIDDRLQ